MTRHIGTVCKLCRREGQKLFLEGERCCTDRCGVGRRAYAPGQHGQGHKKTSKYSLQLRAKQITKRFCGILESQFRGYYDMATRMEGKTSDLLLGTLESRLDNVVYRLGWGSSRTEARQLVVCDRFTINNKRVDIPSYLTKPGEIVSIKESGHSSDKIRAVLETDASCPIPKQVELDRNTLEAKVLAFPEHEDIGPAVDKILTVGLYSK